MKLATKRSVYFIEMEGFLFTYSIITYFFQKRGHGFKKRKKARNSTTFSTAFRSMQLEFS